MLDSLKSGAVAATRWAGRSVVYFDRIDSTNRVARELARQGAPHGTLVIADTQSAGRGRRGREWISPAGEGIFMSLIVRPTGAPAGAAKLSLLTALAVAQAIEETTGLNAQIKWPNDIVIMDGQTGRKVCGMLLEMDFMEGGSLAVTVGVGINVHQTQFDETIAHTASSLDRIAGKRFDRSVIVRAFLSAFEDACDLLERDEAVLMRAYRARSATLGSRVQVIAGDSSYLGVAQDITPGGALLVRADEDGQVREVLAADVSVRGIMGYV